MGSKKFYDIPSAESQISDPGTQIVGDGAVEDSSAGPTTAANFGTLTQEFLPTGR